MLIYAVVLALLVGLVRGGRLAGLADAPLRLVPLIFVSFLIQLGLHLELTSGLEPVARWAGFLHILSYSLLFLAFIANWQLPGMKLMGLGTVLNFVVIAANGARMPVSEQALRRAGLEHLIEPLVADQALTHQILTADTRLAFLGDIFHLGWPFPRPCAFSPGDALLVVGAIILVQCLMLGQKKAAAAAGS